MLFYFIPVLTSERFITITSNIIAIKIFNICRAVIEQFRSSFIWSISIYYIISLFYLMLNLLSITLSNFITCIMIEFENRCALFLRIIYKKKGYQLTDCFLLTEYYRKIKYDVVILAELILLHHQAIHSFYLVKLHKLALMISPSMFIKKGPYVLSEPRR